MTRDEYWQAFLKFQTGTLTEAEQYRFRVAGVLAEAAARDRGSSLVPFDLRVGNSPPQELPDELLIAIGLSVMGISEALNGGGEAV